MFAMRFLVILIASTAFSVVAISQERIEIAKASADQIAVIVKEGIAAGEMPGAVVAVADQNHRSRERSSDYLSEQSPTSRWQRQRERIGRKNCDFGRGFPHNL
jgi:hypothetical protein